MTTTMSTNSRRCRRTSPRRRPPDGGGATIMKTLTDLGPTWSGWYNDCTQGTGSGGSETGGNWTCTQITPAVHSGWKVMPCVTDRYYESSSTYDVTDDAPGSGKWLNAHDGTRMTLGPDSSNTTASGKTGATQALAGDHWNYDDAGDCADVAPSNAIVPLTADKAQLASRIDGLSAYGSTAGALGTAWSWYALSPKWSNVWSGSELPQPYADLTTIQANGAPKLRKVAVLMTDGGYNTYRGYKDNDQQTVSNWAVQLCTNMKAQGIEIYTVGFALNQLSSAEQAIARTTLQACGTDIKHFYETLTVPELKQAFRDIAVSLSTLSLVR